MLPVVGQRVLPNVDDDEVGAMIHGFGGRPFQCGATAGRPVDADHDGLPGTHGRLLLRLLRAAIINRR